MDTHVLFTFYFILSSFQSLGFLARDLLGMATNSIKISTLVLRCDRR